jgi:DNA helicase-2/ATP-dependent DNA helicase PcrA
MSRLLSLTPEQTEAVESRGRPYLLVAPPGSGKTEVLVQRVVWLLRQSQLEVNRILALTFTNKAAESLRIRALDEVGDEQWRLFAGTFHSFCLDVLQNYGSRIGVAPGLSILDSDEDRLETLRRCLEEHSVRSRSHVDGNALRELLSTIDSLRLDLIPVEAAPNRLLHGINIADAYAAYEGQLDVYSVLDFPRILFKGYQLLTTDPWVAGHYRQLYTQVLVDEAQDLNLAQYQVVRAICHGMHDVMFVADRNQSIYAFTGASPKFLDRFIADYHPVELKLSTNFRSAASIVTTANNLATHFSAATTVMGSMPGAPGSVEGWEFSDEQAEASGVVGWIENLLTTGLQSDWIYPGEDGRVTPEDCCILARTRFALEPIGTKLKDHNVPYAMRTGERGLFDSRLAAAIHYCLRLIANDRDLPSYRRLQRLIPLPKLASDQIEIRILPLIERLIDGDEGIPTGVARRLVQLAAGRDTVGSAVDWLSTTIIPELDSPQDDDAVAWSEDQQRLRDYWQRFTLHTPPSDRHLAGFVRFLAQAQRVTLDEPGVRVLTVHTAKGLEFKVVALVGMNDGTFPHYLSLRTEEELDEERRNAYVAITRAARALRLTRASSRVTRLGVRQDPPSRFLAEMGVRLRRRG